MWEKSDRDVIRRRLYKCLNFFQMQFTCFAICHLSLLFFTYVFTEIAQKYKPVIQSYIKQRLLIRMKYFNQHAASLTKKKSKSSIKQNK